MSIKKIFFRDTRETCVEVVESWEVRWQSRYGKHYTDVRDEVRVFILEEDAREFRKALLDAFKLICHTSGNDVTITKQNL